MNLPVMQGESTIVHRERYDRPLTRSDRAKRWFATAVGYTAILALPAVAWMVPPPNHARPEGTIARSSVHIMRPIVSAGSETETVQADPGKLLFQQSCAWCHGANAQGLPHQGLPLDSSPFIAGHNDDAMLQFLRHGRQPTDPLSKLKLAMPARGSPPLRDNDLQQVIGFLREVQRGTALANANASLQPSQ